MEGSPVVYVLKRFPRLSETFVLRELLGLERAGRTVLIDALLPPEDGPRHPDLALLRAPVRYLPRRAKLRHRGVLRAHVGWALRRPLTWGRLALRARRRGELRRFAQAGLVADRVRRSGATHVHAHFATAAAEVARDAAALTGVPWSVTAHAKDVFHADNAPRLVERTEGASCIVTVSRFNVAHLQDVLPGAEVRHVPNAMPLASRAERPADGPVVCVARLIPKKGVDTLLDALAELPGVRAEILGEGPLRADLEAQARRLGVTRRVMFRGPQPLDEVQATLSRAAMLVLPARVAPDGDRDGLPTVILEAMAAGLPVISTTLVGIPEVVRHEETGLLVTPGDPPALAAAIRRLREDRALAARLGDAGRDLVAREFDPSRCAALLLDVLR